MKLREALFQEPSLAYRVLEYYADDWDDFGGWDVQPLSGPTLAAEDVDDVFQGMFIIAAHIILKDATPQPCYMDLTLPERITENHFAQSKGQIERRQGRRAPMGTVIPAIGIESFGNYKLFYAKENPSAGIDVLKSGMEYAREPGYIAYDLGYLLRDEKRWAEAIDAFTLFLEEDRATELVHSVYQEMARMYAAIGETGKAEADKREYALAFQKRFGHPPNSVNQ
jgi:hypothetical protein